MTLVLLDTDAYLRLAKRVRPMLGVEFGQKGYKVTILQSLEDEVVESSRLRERFPWFSEPTLAAERKTKKVRLSAEEKAECEVAYSILRNHVARNASAFILMNETPPSPADCRVLSLAVVRGCIVASDDRGLHHLARDFQLKVWHGHELLKRMHTAQLVSSDLVRDIYTALEDNGDLPASWREAKLVHFLKVFGRKA